ncbi:LysR family transcriptional regulator [Aurantiacibacter poecillastricola]|uniref:LysR family transcriptional regulator n=1 Tax=Aurantiacibacter poecillastricola TaxID=3064385 RepID=UPI00273F4EE0|nr:LysR family transcriptional regulator [Aurantiacibacter sp. 219JJ12-13]MDP5263040.1 LysR family transcriptional regulator [Aurantiacibacter sp. 219JJ12-13]
MDTLINIRTFLTVAREGSFAAGARALEVAPSIVSKRINQLEHQLKIKLFFRSTREITLTADGSRVLPQCEKVLSQFDELRSVQAKTEIAGYLRVDAPGTVTSRIFGPMLIEFLAKYSSLEMDLRLIDRLADGIDLDSDITIGIRPSRSTLVQDFPLMPYGNALYAGPGYIAEHGQPGHPNELANHHCLASLLYGDTWHFYGDSGDFAVTVQPRFRVNDAIILREAVRNDLGIAVLPTVLVEKDLQEGRLVRLLPAFRPPPLWLKAIVPREKLLKPNVMALLGFFQEKFAEEIGMLDHVWEEFAKGQSYRASTP